MSLLAAIFTGREVKARELMALPWTNINAQYANGNTPLILAVQGTSKKKTMMEENLPRENSLIEWKKFASGADLTTLDLIVAGNNDKLVALLLDHPQVNVNLRGLDGYTALIRASGDRADYVAMLLSNPDIDPNLATYFGTTALTYAIR